MKTFENFVKDNFNIVVPDGDIPGSWFVENGLPMVVACTCCDMTMVSFSALVDEDGQCFCSECGRS